MLKIKDNVNLKKLEKFGFKHRPKYKALSECYEYTTKSEEDFYPILRCYILCEDRSIGVNTNEIDILFDLIQSGLVEIG